METTQVWYIEQRAEQLTFVYLSRHDELDIKKQDSDYDSGLDFLVSIVENGKYTGKVFGVLVKANLSLEPIQQGISLPNSFILNIDEPALPEDIPFPLCLFVFAMENDAGYYRWLKEPQFDSKGKPELVLNKVREFKKLTKAELNNIVSQVNLWYEKKSHQIATA